MGAAERNNGFNKWRRGDHTNPQYALYDMYGRLCLEGDTIILPNGGVVQWRLAEIKPDLRPGPQGAPIAILTLAAVMKPVVMCGGPNMDFIKIRDLAEDAPLRADDARPADAPGPTLVEP